MAPIAQTEGRMVGCNATIFHQQPDLLLSKEGGQIPGYVGHCPLLRYDFGKTFGQGTHEAYLTRKGIDLGSRRTTNLEDLRNLSRIERSHTTIGSPAVAPSRDLLGSGAERGQEVIVTKKGIQRRGLPEYDGNNKYTENMVPGYTGYIPRYPFQFGNTYKEECDICLDEHFSNVERLRGQRLEHTLRTSHSAGTLCPLRRDPFVRDQLNDYSGPQHPASAVTPRLGVYNPPVLDKNCELPIPGYRGFVPRVRTTEIGLGTRYTEQTKNGLDSFYERKAEREAKLGLRQPSNQEQRRAIMTSSREINIDRNPVAIENATKWSSNHNGRRIEHDTTSKAQTYQPSSYVCEHREHNSTSNTCATHAAASAPQRNKAQKSVAFVV